MFIHLHTHSHYSLLDGLIKIDQLVARGRELGLPALALTDHGNMYGAIEFYKKCLKAEIKPIIGCEIYLAPRSRFDKQPHLDTRPYHLTLLVKNEIGYKNLLKIVSESHLHGFYYKPRADKEFLKNHSEGLIALSGCPAGEIPRLLEANNLTRAKIALEQYLALFNRDFYLEIQPYHEPIEFKKLTRALVELSREMKVPLVATNDIHYLLSEDKATHEVLLSIQTKKDIDDEKRLSMKDLDISMISAEEMENACRDFPQAIVNTEKIAEQCNLQLKFGRTILPPFELPENKTASQYLEELMKLGFRKRYAPNNQKARERLNYELGVIEKTKFSEYFLIVADFVSWAKEQGIVVGPGRGSGAGSIISYCLNITDLDPLKYNLLFERFLNPERIAPPDFDLDFADDRRDEVIEYITQKYGADHVAQIITFGVMKARLAVRDVTRALGLPYNLGDQIAKLIPLGFELKQALEANAELLRFYQSNEDVKKVIEMSLKLEGVARHASTHAAGLVISKEPLVEYVALQPATSGGKGVMTQYAMNEIADIGLLKIDILGLKNLTIIKNTLRIISKVHGREIDISKIPLDDKKTYQLLSRGETIGVFQLESDGMRRYVKELRPTELGDIIAMVALYRPGPMELIRDFIAGKHGAKTPQYLHPKLRPILEDTYGIAVYQEQVLQIAREIAGFSLGEADILRKAIGKKIQRLLISQRNKFIEGALKNQVKKETAEKIFDFIEPFARYSFNRAHAAGYGLISYQTAYLKTNYPQEFMAALLTSEQNNLDKIGIIIAECSRLGLNVFPPDVNESFPEFGLVPNTKNIRFGLSAIKNVGAALAEKIVEERKLNGLYKSLEDFLSRLAKNQQVNKKNLESLAKVGALDVFAERNAILAGMEMVLKFLQKAGQQAANGQLDLFGSSAKTRQPISLGHLQLPAIEAATEQQRLNWEKELLGIYISSHPLKKISHLIEKNGTAISFLNGEMTGERVRVAGIITSIKKIQTKSGEPMLFVRFEDTTANTEIIVFPRLLERSGMLWRPNNIVAVEGTINTKDGAVKIVADKIEELGEQETWEEILPLIIIFPLVTTKELLFRVKKILAENPGDRPVILRFPQNGEEKEIKLKNKIADSKALLGELKTVGVLTKS